MKKKRGIFAGRQQTPPAIPPSASRMGAVRSSPLAADWMRLMTSAP